MHRLFFNSFTYAEQETATVRELFEPFAADLLSIVGYGIDEALALTDAVASLPMLNIKDRLSAARRDAQRLTQTVDARRSGDVASSDYPDELLDHLAALPAKTARKTIDTLALQWAWHEYGQHAAFSAKELAQAAGVATGHAQRFLDDFSVAFGERTDRDRWEADPRRALGGEIEVMKRRPIIYDGHGLYLPAAPQAQFFGLRDHLTDVLKDTKAWPRFSRHRAKLLEQRAVDSLRGALDASWSHTGLKYRATTAGAEVEGDIDGILRSDGLLVLVEAKAGALAPSGSCRKV